MKKLLLILVVLVATLTLIAGTLRLILGSPGKPFPSLSTAPKMNAQLVQSIADLSEPPGNIAVTDRGRIFFSFHSEARPEKMKVAELVSGNAVPFPSLEEQDLFDTIFSVRVDRQGRLWTLDHGFNGIRQPRLLAFDIATGKIIHQYDFPKEIAGPGSFLNDLQVDSRGERIYIADTSVFARRPAILVYDIRAKMAYRFLEKHQSVEAEDWLIQTPKKKMVFFGGLFALKPAVDSIVLDKNDDWLYFGAMAGSKLYRIQTKFLFPDGDDAKARNAVEVFSDKPLSDGLSIDLDGTIYVTDIENAGIVTINQKRQLQTLFRNEKIRWPDGLSFGPQGTLYLTDSALTETMLMRRSHIKASGPFHIYRIDVGVHGIPGH